MNYVKATDAEGNTIELRGDLTLDDLLRMGMRVSIQARPIDRPSMPTPPRGEESRNWLEPKLDFLPPTGILTAKEITLAACAFCSFEVSVAWTRKGAHCLKSACSGTSLVAISDRLTKTDLLALLPMIKRDFERLRDEHEKRMKKRGPYATKNKPKKTVAKKALPPKAITLAQAQRDKDFEYAPPNHVLRAIDRMRRTNTRAANSLDWFPMPKEDVGRKASYFNGGGFIVERHK